MRVVIDMQGAQSESRFRGIGRYTLSFAQAVVRNRGAHEVLLALNGAFRDTIEPIRAAFDGLLPQENLLVWHAPGPVRERQPGNERRREAAELTREAFLANLAPDVVHVSSLFEGFIDDAVTGIGSQAGAAPVTVSLYDLIPLSNPKQYLEPDPAYARYYWGKLAHLRGASAFFAISEFSRQEAVTQLGVPPSRVVNVSTAVEPRFRPSVVSAEVENGIRRKFSIEKAFVLYTGGTDERKNLKRLLQAFAALPASLRARHQLVLAGRMPAGDVAMLEREASLEGLGADEVRFTGYVSDDELVHLYNLCAVFAFPSWHEGFGLPVLEAMACGAPVIAGNASSLPEVVGLDVALFDPMDTASISARLRQALEDDGFRTMLRRHARERARLFSWDDTAMRAIEGWESCAAGAWAKTHASPPTPRKPRLAFVSPLPPERTGIADYSAELLPSLARHFDIDAVVTQQRVEPIAGAEDVRMRDVAWLREHAHEIDYVVYQMGNSPAHQHILPLLREIPGTVVLHDFFASALMNWAELHAGAPHAWSRELYASHGYRAVADRTEDPEGAKLRYPANFRYLQYANGVIVHSGHARSLATQWYGSLPDIQWASIPLLRAPAKGTSRQAAREALGIGPSDFVVCTFGFVDPTKLHHRLLRCWLASKLGARSECHLVFVGENHGREYGAELLETIRASGADDRIHITGFAPSEAFHHYLAGADLAVQLRTQSRGETSASALDCMNNGLALIVNAHGSMAELDPQSVWMLPDRFDDAELIQALEELWGNPARRRQLGERAKWILQQNHAPEVCARQYADAIAGFRSTTATTRRLIEGIATRPGACPADDELARLSSCIDRTLPLPRPAKRLFLDISATSRSDLKTGIERAVRGLTLALLQAPPEGYRVEPVYLSDEDGVWTYRHASRYTLELLGCPGDVVADEVAEPQNGDILLGLDLFGGLVDAQRQGLLQRTRDQGVLVYFVVYDLLPVRLPLVFPPGAGATHALWLNAVCQADGAICISRAVASELDEWREGVTAPAGPRRPFHISWSHLGADLGNSSPTRGMPSDPAALTQALQARPTFLMVGTIEPRKAYRQAIEAFGELWRNGVEANLVIVGNEGWTRLPTEMRRDIPETIERLRSHPESGRRLFWLSGISDEFLEHLYAGSTCLLAASHGEGFGLPLIEAAQHGTPILARDIPVFREVAGDHASYFQAAHPAELAGAIGAWLRLHRAGGAPRPEGMPRATWAAAAESVKSNLMAAATRTETASRPASTIVSPHPTANPF